MKSFKTTFLASPLCHPKLSLTRGSLRETAKGGGECYKTTPHEKLMRYYFFLLVCSGDFTCPISSVKTQEGQALTPPLIPLSGYACTALSDIDTNQKATI